MYILVERTKKERFAYSYETEGVLLESDKFFLNTSPRFPIEIPFFIDMGFKKLVEFLNKVVSGGKS